MPGGEQANGRHSSVLSVQNRFPMSSTQLHSCLRTRLREGNEAPEPLKYVLKYECAKFKCMPLIHFLGVYIESRWHVEG